MKIKTLLTFGALLTLAACGAGDVGDECAEDSDCADELECHLHEHDGEVSEHGECEAHDEEEHDEDDHDDE